ncbi:MULTISPECIES: hypothetical protein [Vibrio]|uniref:hypothetical protein n=1 Tax=Vibrio TaxID=662 RepID=UPI0010563AF0|nr:MULTISPECIES: hypothetical protein [Vibrio]
MKNLMITTALILSSSNVSASSNSAALEQFDQKQADWACSVIFVGRINTLKSYLTGLSEERMTIDSMSATDFSPTKATCTVTYTVDRNKESSQKSFILTGDLKNLNSIKGLGSNSKYGVIWLDETRPQG